MIVSIQIRSKIITVFVYIVNCSVFTVIVLKHVKGTNTFLKICMVYNKSTDLVLFGNLLGKLYFVF